MKSRQRLAKKLLIPFGILAVLSALYLQFGILPGSLKNIAIEKIESSTRFRVRFDKLLYLPFRGVAFDNLSVAEKSGAPIFSAKQMSFDLKWGPFFKEDKIIVRNVYLESPVYDFYLKPRRVVIAPPPVKTKISGQIDVPVIDDEKQADLAESLASGPEGFLPENVTIEQIEIVDGRVTIRQNPASPILETLQSIRMRLGYRKPPYLVFDGSLTAGQKTHAALTLRGTWNLENENYEFYIQLIGKKVPDWLAEFQQKNLIQLREGQYLLQTRLVNTPDDKILFNAKAQLDDATLELQKTQVLGRVSVEAKGLWNPSESRVERYKGQLKLEQVVVLNLSEEVDRLDRLSGTIGFQPDLLTFQQLEGAYKKIPFRAEGTLKSFAELLLRLSVQTNSSIPELLSLLPDEQKKLFENFKVGGNYSALTTFSGSLKNPETIQKEHKLLIQNGVLAGVKNSINIQNIRSEILVNGSGFKLEDTHFEFNKKSYRLNAFIPKDSAAPGDLELNSDALKLSAHYTLEGNTVTVQSAQVGYRGLQGQIKGRLINLQKPFLDMEGTISADLDQAKDLCAEWAPALKNAGLHGNLAGYFLLKGLWNEPKNWNLQLDAQAKPLWVKNTLRLDDFETQIRMQNQLVNIPYIHAKSYGGVIGARVLFDLSRPKLFFDTKIQGSQINLGALSKDLELKFKNFSGVALFQAAMRGFLEVPESYRGQGALNIQNGSLWETSLFKQMGSLPFVKVEGLDVVLFHTLSGTFVIQDKKVWTQDLTLNSDTVDLSLKGSLSFAQELDFLMDIQFSRDILQGAMNTGGIVPFIVQEASQFISKYRITGTIRNPKYEKADASVIQTVGNTVGSIFKNLAQ